MTTRSTWMLATWMRAARTALLVPLLIAATGGIAVGAGGKRAGVPKFDGAQEIVVRKSYHIGIASSTDAGLLVPVVRDADRKSILDIARDISRLSDSGRGDLRKRKTAAERVAGVFRLP